MMKLKIESVLCLLLLFPFALLSQNNEITVEKIWKNYEFIPQTVPGFSSMPNSDYYSVMNDTAIVKHSFATGKAVSVILSNQMLAKANHTDKQLSVDMIDEYAFDASCSKILIAFEVEPIYRRSTCAYYYVYDLQTNRMFPIAAKENGKQSFAQFSADGTKVAFVRNYNLYYYDISSQKEVQITT